VQQEAQAIFTRLSPTLFCCSLYEYSKPCIRTRALNLRISSRQSAQRVAAIIVISSVECESIANGKSKVKRSSSLGTLSNILIRVLFLRMPGHTYRAREGLNRFLRNGSANFAHAGREKYTSGADFARKSDEEAARVTYNRCTRTGFVCRESEHARAQEARS